VALRWSPCGLYFQQVSTEDTDGHFVLNTVSSGLLPEGFFSSMFSMRFGFGQNAQVSNHLTNGYFVHEESPLGHQLMIQSRGAEYKRHIHGVIARCEFLSLAMPAGQRFSPARFRHVSAYAVG